MGPDREVVLSTRRRPRRSVGGFTLLELIVTLFVLTLALALAMPAIGRGTETVRARADVSRFAALLRHTREQAITTRRPQEVIVDPDAHRASVRSGTDDPRPVLSWPERLSVTASPPTALTVRFEPWGGATGGDFTLFTAGRRYHISVDAVTGRVRTELQ